MENIYPAQAKKSSQLATEFPATPPSGGLKATSSTAEWQKIWGSRGVLIAAVLLVVACIADAARAPKTSTFTEDGITVTAVLPGGTGELVGETTANYTKKSDPTTGLVIEVTKPDHSLLVNEKHYGQLEPGDKVRIEPGKVVVNDKERDPA